MKICVFGAGAVGSHFAVRLALAGHDVSCVMRGTHLQAVQAKGLTLRLGGEQLSAKVRASDNPSELGAQDVVISTLKANALGSLAGGLKPLLKDDTAVVFAQNGIPWWYNIGLPADHPSTPPLDFLDPGGQLQALLGRERIIGGVIFSSNEIVEPGVVVNDSPERNMLIVGECDDRQSDRIQAFAQASHRRAHPVAADDANSRVDLDQADRQHDDVDPVRADRHGASAIPYRTPRSNRWSRACWRKANPSDRPVTRASRGAAAADRRSTTSRRCCRTTNAAGRWRSTRWSRRRWHLRRTAGIATPMLDLMAGLATSRAREKGLY